MYPGALYPDTKPSEKGPACCRLREMMQEPRAGQAGDLIQGAGLFKEMAGAGNDRQLFDRAQVGERRLVQHNDLSIECRRRRQSARSEL